MNPSAILLLPLVFVRVAGLVLTAPIFGAGAVPLHVRALLAATLTLLIAPLQWRGAAFHFDGPAAYLASLAAEALIGACLGLGVLVLVHAMTLAGELISQAAGLGIAEVFDPAIEENVPSFSRLLFVLSVAIFLCIGGHRMLLAGLLDTFQTMPPGREQFGSLAGGLTTLVAQSFVLGVRAAAPAVTALLTATLILGMIGRTLPQLNVLSLGLGLNALLALAVFGLTLAVMVWAFQSQIQPAMETIFELLKTPLQRQWMS
jgi:flagellar biosynthesis protein FliR